jgi:hypothetical protein
MGSPLMEAPRRYSVSPLHSFVTVPTRPVFSFADALKAIVRWVTGRAKLSMRERFLEQRAIEQLADELGDAPNDSEP